MVHLLLVIQVTRHNILLTITIVWYGRNDMDTVGIRAGCTFTGYSDSKFNGNRIDIKAGLYDR